MEVVVRSGDVVNLDIAHTTSSAKLFRQYLVFVWPKVVILFLFPNCVKSLKILNHPGHGYPSRVELRSTRLGCRYLKMFCFFQQASSILTDWNVFYISFPVDLETILWRLSISQVMVIQGELYWGQLDLVVHTWRHFQGTSSILTDWNGSSQET